MYIYKYMDRKNLRDVFVTININVSLFIRVFERVCMCVCKS